MLHGGGGGVEVAVAHDGDVVGPGGVLGADGADGAGAVLGRAGLAAVGPAVDRVGAFAEERVAGELVESRKVSC